MLSRSRLYYGNKYRNLILCAREDHNPDSSNYKAGGPKIHFDLSGYDILWWSKDNLDEFKVDSIKKIKKRLSLVDKKKDTSSAV